MAAAGPAGKRGRGGFRNAGAAARPALKPLAERQGFAEAEVLMRWSEIAGEALARLCHPVKVSYGRGALGATLMLRAEGPAALEVEHRAPQIIERINAHYGYRAISRIAITQGTGLAGEARGFAEGAAPFEGPAADRARPADSPWRGEARPPAPVTADARARAAALAEGIADPRLRAALERMGAYVLSRKAGRGPTE